MLLANEVTRVIERTSAVVRFQFSVASIGGSCSNSCCDNKVACPRCELFCLPVVKTAYTILLLLLAVVLHAQILPAPIDSVSRLFSAKKFESGAYVGFDANATQIAKGAGMIAGAQLSWLVNHRYNVNLRYEALSTRVDTVGYLLDGDYKRGQYVRYTMIGLGAGYIVFHNKRFSLHPEINGGVYVYRYHTKTQNKLVIGYGSIVPNVAGVFNAHKNIRIGVQINYRIAIASKNVGLASKYLNGIGGGVFMRIGKF